MFEGFFFNVSGGEFKFDQKSDKITGCLREDLCRFTILRSVLFRMRSVADKSCRNKYHTRYVQYIFPEYHAFYEIIWQNMVQGDSPQITYNMAHALCMLDN